MLVRYGQKGTQVVLEYFNLKQCSQIFYHLDINTHATENHFWIQDSIPNNCFKTLLHKCFFDFSLNCIKRYCRLLGLQNIDFKYKTNIFLFCFVYILFSLLLARCLFIFIYFILFFFRAI